jgi:hypothetical protein
MDRLVDCFGDKAFGNERVRIIWRNVNALSDQWLVTVVDNFIATAKYAPLPADFYEFAALERERLWQIEKLKNASEAKTFMATYGAEEIQQVCATIRDRINGAMSDEHFTSFQKLLRTAPTKETYCPACSGDGWLVYKIDGGDTANRCFCPDGGRKPQGIRQLTYGEWKQAN